MSDYTPIDCGLYSQYELYIMHREPLRMAWHDASGNEHLEVVRPKDLRTESGAEYMVCEQGDGTLLKIRLDRIVRAEPVAGATQP